MAWSGVPLTCYLSPSTVNSVKNTAKHDFLFKKSHFKKRCLAESAHALEYCVFSTVPYTVTVQYSTVQCPKLASHIYCVHTNVVARKHHCEGEGQGLRRRPEWQ